MAARTWRLMARSRLGSPSTAQRSKDLEARIAKSRALAGPSPDAIVSRASLRRNGPRSGLSREASDKAGLGGVSGVFFLEREGEGEGGFFGSGEGVLLRVLLLGSDLCVWDVGVLGTEIRRVGASAGVFTETRPGMVCELRLWG